MEPFDDPDSDMEDPDPMVLMDDGREHLVRPNQRRPRPGPNAMPLHHFLRLIAGGPLMDHGAAESHTELIAKLQRGGAITQEPVARAMRLCPRDLFVPPDYRNEALIDAPIRLEHLEFNISAPHMHATMIEALDIKPNQKLKVLDVGSGCGLVAACCAILTGPEGSVVGIDIRREAIEMAKETVESLQRTSEEFVASAAPIHFETSNVFCLMGRLDHIGAYDRVHVGASCPADRVGVFLDLLKSSGGTVVVPVAPSDLKVITKKPNGSVHSKVISQVRFSELEIPGDAEVVLSAVAAERKQHSRFDVEESTYTEDVAVIVDNINNAKNETLSTSPGDVLHGFPGSPYFGADRSSSVPTHRHVNYHDFLSLLGQPDCILVGGGSLSSSSSSSSSLEMRFNDDGTDNSQSRWEVPAHSLVLCQRCDLLKARCRSGMSDAALSTVNVPDHFSERACTMFLEYLYKDTVTGLFGFGDRKDGAGMSQSTRSHKNNDLHNEDRLVELLHVAMYFGVQRLVQLCEEKLVKILLKAQRSLRTITNAADTCVQCLALSRELGLEHLQTVALDISVSNYDIVSKTEAWDSLGKEEVALVACEASQQLGRVMKILHQCRDAEVYGLDENGESL